MTCTPQHSGELSLNVHEVPLFILPKRHAWFKNLILATTGEWISTMKSYHDDTVVSYPVNLLSALKVELVRHLESSTVKRVGCKELGSITHPSYSDHLNQSQSPLMSASQSRYSTPEAESVQSYAQAPNRGSLVVLDLNPQVTTRTHPVC